MLSSTQLKNNTLFIYKDEPHKVLLYKHTHLGRGGGKIRVKVKNLKTGTVLEVNFGSNDHFDVVYLEKRTLKYLRQDGNDFLFYDEDEEEERKVPLKIIGEDAKYLTPEQKYSFSFWEEEPLEMELPYSMIVEIAECDPGVKGNSAVNLYKKAVTTGGLEIKVPLFVDIGDKVKIDTRSGEYLERA